MASKFWAAYHSFAPAADDPSHAIPFYRTAAAIRAVVGDEWCRVYWQQYHRAFCEGEGPRGCAMVLEEWARKAPAPAAYRLPIFHVSEPVPPTDREAREIFLATFRAAFPGRRANSKEANAMWRESRDRCVEAAERQYGRQTREHVAALARHTEACRLIIDEHARNVQEYTAMCAAMREAAQKLREDADR